MATLIRILQIVLALWTITGAVYMMGHYGSLASTWAFNTLPSIFWIILGIIQIIFSVGLLISAGNGALSKYAKPSAIGLAVISFLGAFLYSAYAGFPGILWALIPAALFLFVVHTKEKPNR